MATPINIQFPLKRSSNGAFETNSTTVNAVADDLKILILTNHGERPIHKDYGANLRSVLFEPQDSSIKQKIADLIFVAVEKWMPFVFIGELDVVLSSEDLSLNSNEVRVKIKFSVLQERGQLEVSVAA